SGADANDSSYSAPSDFENALDDDLNISAALGHLFDVIRESNRALDQSKMTPADARVLLDWWTRINRVLGFDQDPDQVPPEVLQLLEERKQARASKDWKQSDAMRVQIESLGWLVKDTKDGQKVTKA